MISVSIIIPIYNVEPYIVDCIQSVMRQTHQGPMECILVDDCGTDDSMAIVEKMIAEYKGPIDFKILHHEHNRGLSAARNTGTDAAKGDYVYYLDSDDYISDDCIELLAKPIQNTSFDIVVGDCVPFHNSKRLTENSAHLWVEMTGEYSGPELIEACFTREIYGMACNKLCRLAFLRENDISFYEGIIHEDDLWHFYIVKYIKTMYVIVRPTYYYRIRTDSIIGKVKQDDFIAADSLNKIIRQIVCDDFANSTYSKARTSYIISLIQRYLKANWRRKSELCDLFMFVRSHWNYNPWKLFCDGHISVRDVKKHLYFVLPPILGWWYLFARTWKNMRNL